MAHWPKTTPRAFALVLLTVLSGCTSMPSAPGGAGAEPADTEDLQAGEQPMMETPPPSSGHAENDPVAPLIEEEAPPAPPEVARTPICFEVHNQPFGTPPQVAQTYLLRGMRYSARPVASDDVAILLVSGGGHPYQYWDHDNVSVAAGLARAGYTVFAYDRLGYLNSRPDPVPVGWGAQSMFQNDMTHEVVLAVRAGTYMTGDACEKGRGVPVAKLVLAGQSFGSAYIVNEVGHYQSADAVIPGEFGHMGLNPQVLVYLGQTSLTVQPNGLADFPADQTACLDLIFWQQGADQDVMDAYCNPILEENQPVSEAKGLPWMLAENPGLIATTFPDVPVLLMWGDHSMPLGLADRQRETQWWLDHCACNGNIEVWIQPDSGHDFNLHRTSWMYVEKVTAWLAGHGLGPQEVRE